MSGGGGGGIIIHKVRETLSNPIVHGALPQQLKDIVDPILAKPIWDDDDKLEISKVHSWALCNLK